MFIPLIVAILLGLIAPTTNSTNCNSGTVYVSSSEPTTAGDPGDPNDGGGDEDTGEDGPGTVGDTGQTPPPKP